MIGCVVRNAIRAMSGSVRSACSVVILACSAPSARIATDSMPNAVGLSPSSPTNARMTTASETRSDTLDVEALLPLIARVDAEAAATLRSTPATTAAYERMPFYPAGGLLRVDALLPSPVRVRYVYVPARHALFPVGTPERVREANTGARLRLTPEVGVAYVRFYLEVAGDAGWTARRLAASADEVPWLPATTTEPDARAVRARLSRRIPQAEATPADGGLRVTAATVRGQVIEVVTFHVAGDGTVTLGQVTPLAADAPVVQVL